MNDEIKDMMLPLGANVCGIENINCFNEVPKVISPCGIFENCKFVITFGVALPKGLTQVEPR